MVSWILTCRDKMELLFSFKAASRACVSSKFFHSALSCAICISDISCCNRLISFSCAANFASKLEIVLLLLDTSNSNWLMIESLLAMASSAFFRSFWISSLCRALMSDISRWTPLISFSVEDSWASAILALALWWEISKSNWRIAESFSLTILLKRFCSFFIVSSYENSISAMPCFSCSNSFKQRDSSISARSDSCLDLVNSSVTSANSSSTPCKRDSTSSALLDRFSCSTIASSAICSAARRSEASRSLSCSHFCNLFLKLSPSCCNLSIFCVSTRSRSSAFSSERRWEASSSLNLAIVNPSCRRNSSLVSVALSTDDWSRMTSPARRSNWVSAAHLTPNSSGIIAISRGLAGLLSDFINCSSSWTRSSTADRSAESFSTVSLNLFAASASSLVAFCCLCLMFSSCSSAVASAIVASSILLWSALNSSWSSQSWSPLGGEWFFCVYVIVESSAVWINSDDLNTSVRPLSSLTRADRASRPSVRTSIDARCSSIRCDGMDEESGVNCSINSSWKCSSSPSPSCSSSTSDCSSSTTSGCSSSPSSSSNVCSSSSSCSTMLIGSPGVGASSSTLAVWTWL